MRKSISIILLAGVALACVAVQQLESKPQSGDAARVHDFGFGLRLAGSYFGTFTANLPDSPTVPALFVVNADGCSVVTTAELHGGGFPEFLGKNSPHHNVWTRTGVRETTWKSMVFVFNQDGALESPLWNKAAFFRNSGVGEFDKDFQTYTGTGLAEGFTVGQDPLDPEAEPVASYTFSYSFRRINAL